tara:strand:+ start:294 stop:710 length:417 start_codon:yes stop_codon:yes gene_type:complete
MRNIFRIRAILDDSEDIIRDFEIDVNSSLDDLHNFINKSFGFDGSELASFYKSNSQWEQGEELPLTDLNEENQSKAEMLISEIVSNDLKQLIYVYDFLRLWTFYIQVIEEAQIIDTQNYPKLIFSHGNITESRLNKEL